MERVKGRPGKARYRGQGVATGSVRRYLAQQRTARQVMQQPRYWWQVPVAGTWHLDQLHDGGVSKHTMAGLGLALPPSEARGTSSASSSFGTPRHALYMPCTAAHRGYLYWHAALLFAKRLRE